MLSRQASLSHPIGSHTAALPGLFLIEVGLILDWITTVLAVGYAGGFEANPYAKPLLSFFMIPWHILHATALLATPYAVLHVHGRVPENQFDLLLGAALVVGTFLTSVGIHNLLGIFRIA